ncbi:MAG: transglutaminase domain-containing protein [Planctomycetia bacterium]|nr:transglutaminase domain-containing protein [Planctomycetia bacterium]
MKFWLLLAAICGSAALALGDDAVRLDPTQPYSAKRSNPVAYDVEFQVVVTAPYKTKLLRVWLPIPTSDAGQEVLSSELTTFPESVTPQIADEPLFGNRFAYFEFANPQGGQIIKHKLKIKVWELRWNVDSANVQSVKEWPTSFASYRRSESQAVVADARFEKLLQQIVPQRRGGLHDLDAVMTWVSGSFTYDHVNASLAGSSVHAIEQRRGHCSDYHGFCAAMGRLIGQPTRITYGINTFPKNSPSHCKLEAFLPPYGWVSFDVSETQKLVQSLSSNRTLTEADRATIAAAANRRLLSGFRDNTWYLQTRGSDYELVPKATSRVPVVRTIYAEADGQALTDPDPSNAKQTAFPWMTAHKFQPDHAVTYPFTDTNSLNEWQRK